LKSFLHRVHLASEISLSNWWILFRAWWRLLYFHLVLKWISLEELGGSAKIAKGDLPCPGEKLRIAEQVQRLVYWASRLHVIPTTCLDRSLTLQFLLSERNIPAELRIGVEKSANRIHAHAWVEVSGIGLGEVDGVAKRFAVLESSAKIENDVLKIIMEAPRSHA